MDEPCGMLFLRYRKLLCDLTMNGQRSLSIFQKALCRYIVHTGYFASSLIGNLNADETALVLGCVKGSRYLNEVLTCLEWRNDTKKCTFVSFVSTYRVQANGMWTLNQFHR